MNPPATQRTSTGYDLGIPAGGNVARAIRSYLSATADEERAAFYPASNKLGGCAVVRGCPPEEEPVLDYDWRNQ